MKATINVMYHKISDLDKANPFEDLELIIIPHTSSLHESEITKEYIKDVWQEELSQIIGGIDFDRVYLTLFEMKLSFDEDFWGEEVIHPEVKLIDHKDVGSIDLDGFIVLQ